jgi:hypothetical protein
VALAPFFDRIYSALGGHLAVSRDDLTTSLEGVIVGVACAAELSENDLWIAELTTNLLARLYPRMAITGPEDQRVNLQTQALEINPDIEFGHEAPPQLTIGVGGTDSHATLFPSASGWVARLSHSVCEGSGPSNPYAAGAAAAFAAAELFRRIFLDTSANSDFSISLLRFDKTSGADGYLPSSSLGDVLFVAVGAVGNGAIWALARDHGRSGRLVVIDNEQLELSNLQRYVLGTFQDVSKQKVLLAREALSHSQIAVETSTSTLESFANENSGIKIPTICISVDNVASRRAAQALLPKLIVNGWTGEQALGASWHVFSREAACLSCLYHPQGEGISQTEQAARALGLAPDRAALLWVTRLPLSDEDIAVAAKKLGVSREALGPWRGKSLGDLYTDVVCGAVPISLPVTSRVETVPLAHQSVLAGILMASELVKRTNPDLARLSQSEPLVSWDDVLRPPAIIWAKPRAREKGCICGDIDYQSIYRQKWENELTFPLG